MKLKLKKQFGNRSSPTPHQPHIFYMSLPLPTQKTMLRAWISGLTHTLKHIKILNIKYVNYV